VVTQALPRARSPERIAWTVLLGAFATFVLLVGSLVIGGRWWLLNATVSQSIVMAPTGNVLVTRPGRSVPELNITDIPVGSEIRTEDTAQASLNFILPDTHQVLATVRLFGGTVLAVTQADSPRYFTGTTLHRITLKITGGRMRATIGVDVARPVRVEVDSDTDVVTVLDDPGSNVSVEEVEPTVTNVTVRDGTATVSASGSDVVLSADQRAEVSLNAAPAGPYPAEQNLIRNGDFTQPLTGTWTMDARPPADPNESAGTAAEDTVNGLRTMHFARTGTNWGHAGVTQAINRDVQGLTSLRLNMDVQIDSQDVRNCGLLGTECPLMVKISYIDVGGGAHEWLQGFYWYYDPNPASGLTYCATCFPIQFKHLLWPLAEWQTYTSEDLLQRFALGGAQAATIQSITIYGEGHTFDSLVTDVQLLANE
jgi:hypothetical protein